MISDIVERGIAIVAKEIELIEKKQKEGSLDKMEFDKLVDAIKTLIIIEKDRRSEKEQEVEQKTDAELEEAILQEAKKIEEKRATKATATASSTVRSTKEK